MIWEEMMVDFQIAYFSCVVCGVLSGGVAWWCGVAWRGVVCCDVVGVGVWGWCCVWG